MTPEMTIWAVLGVPLLAAALIPLFHRHPNQREAVSIIAAVILFALVASLTQPVIAGARPSVTIVTLIPGLALSFTVEPLGLLFGLVASGLWIVTTLYSIGYMRGHKEDNQTRFFVFFAIALGAAMGIAFAGNMLTLFVFYEILTLGTYPLVTHAGTDEAKRAGRVYLGLLLGTSFLFLLVGMVWTWTIAGSLDFTPGGILKGKADGPVVAVLLALYTFGIGKAALMPFHRWLPAAMVAPTPVSALLHAVAVVKAGVFSVLKVVIYIFGADHLSALGSSVWLQYVAAATLLIASLVAITKDDLKARLAYSTVSQLSYIVLGAMLVNASALLGGGLHIAAHALGKITLFFCAGAIMVATHKRKVSQLNGIGQRMPWTLAAFTLASLSIIGLPPTGGAWSKWHLMVGAVQADQMPFVIVLMLSSLLSAGYLFPVVARAFFRQPDEPRADSAQATETGSGEAPLFCVLPLCLTAVGTVVLFFFADRVTFLLRPILQP